MLALLLLIAQTQVSAPASITYTNFGARTEVVLGELSKLYGQPLKTDDAIKDQPLTIRVKDVQPTELLTKIAQVEEGSWVNKDNVKTLVIDREERAKRRAAQAQENYQLRLKGLMRFVKTAKSEANPANLALAHLIEQIGPETLAAQNPAYHQVYATRPSPLEHPLPELEPSDLAALALASSGTTNGSRTAPDGSRLVVSFSGWDSALLAGVSLVTPDNHANMQMFDLALPPTTKSEGPPSALETLFQQKSTDLPLPKLVKSLIPALDQSGPFDESLRPRLLDPYHFDPSAILGEILVEWADTEKVQLVSALGDSPFEEMQKTSVALILSGGAEALLETPDGSFDGKWVVAKAPLMSGFDSTPRPKASQLEKGAAYPHVINTSTPSLEQLHEAHRLGLAEGPFPAACLWPELYIALQDGQGFLEWYDCLSEKDIAMLSSEKPVAVQQLSEAAQSYFVRGFFAGGIGAGSLAINKVGPGEMPGLMLDDPYEVANAVLPAGATITLKTSKVTAFQVSSPGKAGRRVAYASLMDVVHELGDDLNRRITVGSAQELSYEFYCAGNAGRSVTLHLFHFADAPQYLPANLPPDLKKRFEEAVKQWHQVQNSIQSVIAGPTKP